jgi:hypothetical protein
MLYVHASVLFSQDMATPKEMVDARLRDLKMSKATLARKLGYAGYQWYYDVFSAGRTKLTDELLEQISEALGWPRDHFKKPGATLRRSEYVQREFAKFLDTEVGREAHPETIKILSSMQWTGEFLPSAKLFAAVTLAMEGRYTPAQLVDAMRLEEGDAETGSGPDETQARKVAKRKR